jgi:hypothetical protein
VEAEDTIHDLKFCRLDQVGVRYLNGMQHAVQALLPEAQEPEEFREFRADVVLLPHIALQEPRVVRPPVIDMGCGEPKTGELTLERFLLGSGRSIAGNS